MDTSTIAGTSALMSASQTQQGLSISMMKQAADQQAQMANMLAQNARQATPPVDSGYTFSAYA